MTSDALAPNPVRPLPPLLTLEERRQKLRERMLSLLQEAGNRLFHSGRIQDLDGKLLDPIIGRKRVITLIEDARSFAEGPGNTMVLLYSDDEAIFADFNDYLRSQTRSNMQVVAERGLFNRRRHPKIRVYEGAAKSQEPDSTAL